MIIQCGTKRQMAAIHTRCPIAFPIQKAINEEVVKRRAKRTPLFDPIATDLHSKSHSHQGKCESGQAYREFLIISD